MINSITCRWLIRQTLKCPVSVYPLEDVTSASSPETPAYPLINYPKKIVVYAHIREFLGLARLHTPGLLQFRHSKRVGSIGWVFLRWRNSSENEKQSGFEISHQLYEPLTKLLPPRLVEYKKRLDQKSSIWMCLHWFLSLSSKLIISGISRTR